MIKKVLVFLVIMMMWLDSSFASCTFKLKYTGDRTKTGKYSGSLNPWYTEALPRLQKAISMGYFEGQGCLDRSHVTINFENNDLLTIEGVKFIKADQKVSYPATGL